MSLRLLFRGWQFTAFYTAIVSAEMDAAVTPEDPPVRAISVEQALMLGVDALFLFVGVVYGSRVLAPKPMTYLSEIAFPLDFCGKLAASFTLFLLHGLRWLYQQIVCYWLLYHQPFGRDQQNVIAMMETLAWGMSTSLLWMEYRRGLTPSVYLRLFWVAKWLDASYLLFAFRRFAVTLSDDSRGTSYVSGMVFGGVCYVASAILVLLLFVRPTTVTSEYVAYTTEVNTPSAFLNPSHHQPPTSLYGSFRDWEFVAYPIVEERAMLDISIPAATASIWGNRQFVSFKVVVQTEEDHWTLRRPYSDFASLDEELPEEVRADCQLPQEEYESRKFISWKNRPRSLKSRLEKYLKQVLNHPKLKPYASQALCEFLDMEYVEEGPPKSGGSYHSNSQI